MMVVVVVVMVMLVGFFLTSLVNRRALSNAVVMALPYDVGVSREGKQTFDRFPDLNVPPTVNPGPDTQNILAAPHAENSTANLVGCLCKLVANDSQQEILPVSISHTLLQPYNPLAAFLICIVLPYWTNAFLEDMVVGNGREKRGSLKVGVYRPKAFHGRDRCEGDGRFFVVGVFRCRGTVPDHPGGLQGMLFGAGTRTPDPLALCHSLFGGADVSFVAGSLRGAGVGGSAGGLGSTERGESTGT